ncbi:unnamed protein product [Rotaria sp. Silwood1]|nr:unnamed protein product [Rotaria sp. Silwood1]
MNSESKETITEKILVLLQRLINDIWTSPINLILVFLIIFLLFKLFLLKRKPTHSPSPSNVKPPLPKMTKQDLTIEELRKYNGIDSNGRILTAIYGDIFDVSRRIDLYGPGGSYSLFAGRDATRALSKMQLTQSLFANEYDDLADLTDGERSTARNWHEDFREKYDIIGRLLKPGEQPSVYPTEEPTVDDNINKEKEKQESLRSVHSESSIIKSISGESSVIFDNNDDYEKQADKTIDEIWKIFKDDNSWLEEAKSHNGLDIVVSKIFPKWGKIFRLTSTITGSHSNIVEMLFEHQEDIPKWSPTVNDCRILEVINNDLYITYQITNEQAQGFISKRDFVNLTIRRFIDDIAILAAQACHYSKMPPNNNCVRAKNGPTAYIVEKLDETTCKFTWLLNVDLKGWLPQYLINSSLANVQLGLAESLRNYISNIVDIELSYSSSTSANIT